MKTLEFSDIESYIDMINNIPVLTHEKEKELIIKKEYGDMQAYNRLVECNLRRVIPIAQKYSHLGIPLEDLIQEGNICLLDSIRNFNDPNKYLSRYIYNSVNSKLKKIITKYSVVSIPTGVAQNLTEMLLVYNEFIERTGSELTDTELSNLLNLSLEKFKQLKNLKPESIESFQRLIELEGQELEKDYVYNRDFQLEDDIYNTELINVIDACIKTLSVKQQFIIKLYFGFADGRCYCEPEIAKILGVSNQAVDEQLKRGLMKIANKLKHKDNGEFVELYCNQKKNYKLSELHCKVKFKRKELL